ncbi:NADP-dependent oxidoreductase [Actinocrispum sp. NPDC049592]|uniref:NADP-dependent oxidoreductase n=1 Tax=Actinocrispum sp. NPDC049592 TaxID=3154835 RepID=UPI0034283292
MKAIRIHVPGGPLAVEEAPYPKTGVGDVVVEVRAASFTPDELDWPSTWTDRAGRDRTPSVPGHEVAGVVVEVGYGTTGLEAGDRVFGLTDPHRDGGAAQYVAAEARDLAKLPEEIDFVTGAALVMPGLTAWQALFVHGKLRRGRTVVVHGAAGGVGSLAVQLAKDAGAHVIGTGRAETADLIRELGADEFAPVDQAPQADLVFDTIGVDLPEAGLFVSVTKPQGRYFIVEPNRDQLSALAQLVVQGRLKPRIGAVYPLDQAAEAFQAKQGTAGKTVLVQSEMSSK